MLLTAILTGIAVFFITFFGGLVRISVILTAFFFLSMGFYRYGVMIQTIQNIEKYCTDGQSYDIYGRIKGIDKRRNSGKVYVQLENIRIGDSEKYKEESRKSVKIKGRIQVVFEESSDILKQGRYIRLTAVYAEFKEPRNEGSFNSRVYYNSMGIYGLFYSKPENIQWAEKRYNIYIHKLIEVRNDMSDRLYEMTGEKYASILAGILLGYKSEINDTTKTLYQTAGISHLLAISGLHISVIGLFVYRLLRRRFRFAVSGVVAFFFILSFGIMTGGGISVKRAMIMFLLGILAEMTGRTYDMLSALSLAAILIIVELPMAPESATMQLSFGALLGIGLAGNRINNYLRVKSGIVRTFITSECINLMTRPIIAIHYYQIPLFSTMINLVVLPIFGIVLCGGFISLGVSFLCARLSGYIMLLPVKILQFYEVVCRGYGTIPGSTQITGRPSERNLHIYYGIISSVLLILWILERRNRWKEKEEEYWYIRYSKKGIIITVSILLNLLILYGYNRETCIKMLDVGQGDSIYIGTRQGVNILIDAGSSSNSKITEYEILPFLKANAVKRISYLIMTHSDQDHINGMIPLLTSRYQNQPYVKCLVVPDIAEEVRDESYHQLVDTAWKNGVKVLYLSAGMEIAGKGITLSCIYPSQNVSFSDKNELSLNCILLIEGISVMFTGDLEEEGERYLIQSGKLRTCDILKVAHHGSDGSSLTEYINRIQPGISLISCSADNGYGHPGSKTLSRLKAAGSKIYITKDCGQITIHIREKEGYSVERFID